VIVSVREKNCVGKVFTNYTAKEGSCLNQDAQKKSVTFHDVGRVKKLMESISHDKRPS
jgi:hypothetical protein